MLTVLQQLVRARLIDMSRKYTRNQQRVSEHTSSRVDEAHTNDNSSVDDNSEEDSETSDTVESDVDDDFKFIFNPDLDQQQDRDLLTGAGITDNRRNAIIYRMGTEKYCETMWAGRHGF